MPRGILTKAPEDHSARRASRVATTAARVARPLVASSEHKPDPHAAGTPREKEAPPPAGGVSTGAAAEDVFLHGRSPTTPESTGNRNGGSFRRQQSACPSALVLDGASGAMEVAAKQSRQLRETRKHDGNDGPRAAGDTRSRAGPEADRDDRRGAATVEKANDATATGITLSGRGRCKEPLALCFAQVKT